MPEIQITVKDATTVADVAATGSIRFTPSRLSKDGFIRTAAPFEVALGEGGAGTVTLDVTPPGVAYKVVEHFVGGDGSGDRYVVVEEGDTRYELLTVVSKPGTSHPTAVWEANLQSTMVRAEAAQTDAAAAVEAVDALAQTVADLPALPSLAEVATSGAYSDLSGKPSIPSIAGLATTGQVADAVAPKLDATTAATTYATKATVAADHRTSLIAVGDSITHACEVETASATSFLTRAWGYLHWVQFFLRQRFHVTEIDGVSGDFMSGIRDRVPSLITRNPGAKYLWLLGGINSIQNRESAAKITGEYREVYALAAAAGITVIHGTILPCGSLTDHSGSGGSTPAQKRVILEQVNAWITEQGNAQPNVIVIPWHVPLTDPATGLPRVNTMQDGTHPTTLGAQIMGQAAAAVLSGIIPPTGERLTASQVDAANGIEAAALMLGTSGQKNSVADASVPTGWNVLTTGTQTATVTTPARADGVGNWLQLVIGGGASGTGTVVAQHQTVNLPTANGAIPNEVPVYAMCEVEMDADFANATRLELQVQTPGTVYKMAGYAAANSSDLLRMGGIKGVLKTAPMLSQPAAYADKRLQVRVEVRANTGATATIRIGRVTFHRVGTDDGIT